MSLPEPSQPSYAGLDFLRGLSAAFVMAEHARAFVLQDFRELQHPTLANRLFYFATGLGHEAVMVFFVLSGFFISRSVLSAGPTWNWVDYAVARLSRLWTVLVPSLIFTFILDHVAQTWFGPAFYSGELPFYNSGPDAEAGGAAYSLATFGGNVFFLQTILVPVFGSNGPLWSLANEFWYYILFPLAFFCLEPRRGQPFLARAINAFLFVMIALFLPAKIVVLGLVWLMGFAAYFAEKQGLLRRIRESSLAVGLGLCLFLAALAVSRLHILERWGYTQDLVLGAATAFLVWVIAARGSMIFRRIGSDFMSRISYTLYLFHFPLIAFLAAALLGNRRLPAGYDAYTVLAIFFGVGVLVSWIAYLCFERQTAQVRRVAAAFAGRLSYASLRNSIPNR